MAAKSRPRTVRRQRVYQRRKTSQTVTVPNDPYWLGVVAQPGRLADFDEEWWSLAQAEFASMAEDVRHVSIQTLDQAVKGEWFDDGKDYDVATGGVKLGVPYRKHLDAEFTQGMLDETAELIGSLERLFASGRLTPQFVSGWARFNYTYGYITSLTMNFGDEAKGERNRRKGTDNSKREDARRWIARLITPLLDEGVSRKVAEVHVARAVQAFIAAGVFPDGFNDTWFKRLLRPNGYLVTTVEQKYFSNRRLREHARLTDLPSLQSSRYPEAEGRGPIARGHRAFRSSRPPTKRSSVRLRSTVLHAASGDENGCQNRLQPRKGC